MLVNSRKTRNQRAAADWKSLQVKPGFRRLDFYSFNATRLVIYLDETDQWGIVRQGSGRRIEGQQIALFRQHKSQMPKLRDLFSEYTIDIPDSDEAEVFFRLSVG